MNLMILDGNSIVNRAFYGVRPLNAPDGTPTNAVYGFLAILQRLLDEQKPDALCVVHGLEHVLRQLAELVIHDDNGRRLLAQHLLAVLENFQFHS